MSRLLPKYLGQLRRRTNAQLLGWQLFNMIKYGCVLLIAIAMARWVAEKELIKVYEEIVLVGATLSFYFISGLGQTILPFYEKTKGEGESLFRMLFHQFFFLGALTGLGLIVYSHFKAPDFSTSYQIFALAFLLNTPTYALENYYLVHKKQVPLLLWGLFAYVVQLPFLLIPLIFFNDLEWGLAGLAIVSAFKFLIALYVLKIGKKIPAFWQKSKAFFSYSFPVVLSFILGGSFLYVNAFIVEHYLTDQSFLNYRYGAREFPLFLIISNSFSLIYSGKIAAGLKENQLEDRLLQFKQKSKKVMHQLFPLAIVLVLVSYYLFQFFYGAYFDTSFLVFNFFILLLLSRVLFPQTILVGLGKTKYFSYASAAELALGVCLSLLWVEDHGVMGVALAMICAFTVEKLILIAVCYREKVPFFKYFPVGLYLGYMSLLLAAFWVSYLYFY